MKLKMLLLIGLFLAQITSVHAWYGPWQHSKNKEYQKYLENEISKDLFGSNERYQLNENENYVNEASISFGWSINNNEPSFMDKAHFSYMIDNEYQSTGDYLEKLMEKDVLMRVNRLCKNQPNSPKFKIIYETKNDLIYMWSLDYDDGVLIFENNIGRPKKFVVNGKKYSSDHIPVIGFGRIIHFEDKFYHVYRTIAFEDLNEREKEKLIESLRNIRLFNNLLKSYTNN